MRHILVMILAIINLNCVPGLSFLSPLHSSLRPSVQNNHFYRASRLPACWPAYWPTRPIVPCAAEDSSGEVSHFPADTSVGWKKEKEEDDVKLKDGVMPCIPVRASKLSVPGQQREVHMYDTSTLAVLKYSVKYTGGYYVQVVIDEGALKERKLRLHPYGVLRKVTGTQAGIHRNSMGERSDRSS